MDKRKGALLLAFLLVMLLAVNYKIMNNAILDFLEEKESAIVERIIDGDTIVVYNDIHVRLLGVNTPERGEDYYQNAKKFLEEKIANKTILLESGNEEYDRYGRKLAYVFLNQENINLELVRNGFANPYIYDNDMHTSELRQAWTECIESQKNLCEKSEDKCSDCLELKKLDVESQTVIFYNSCDFDCVLTNWGIKDEGRKKFVFPDFILGEKSEVKIIVGNETDSESELFWRGEEYVWTSSGDTLFLRDREGNLVLWEGY